MKPLIFGGAESLKNVLKLAADSLGACLKRDIVFPVRRSSLPVSVLWILQLPEDPPDETHEDSLRSVMSVDCMLVVTVERSQSQVQDMGLDLTRAAGVQ